MMYGLIFSGKRKMARYQSTKTFGNDRGLSCVFRQPNANHSHCKFFHGYSLGFKFVFECETLDEKNWAYDFGNTKWIKSKLEDWFDHKVALDLHDDHLKDSLEFFEKTGTGECNVFDGVGCEKFAEHVYNFVSPKVLQQTENRVKLISVECFEHSANSAVYFGE